MPFCIRLTLLISTHLLLPLPFLLPLLNWFTWLVLALWLMWLTLCLNMFYVMLIPLTIILWFVFLSCCVVLCCPNYPLFLMLLILLVRSLKLYRWATVYFKALMFLICHLIFIILRVALSILLQLCHCLVALCFGVLDHAGSCWGITPSQCFYSGIE